jgi:hypothetical protein
MQITLKLAYSWGTEQFSSRGLNSNDREDFLGKCTVAKDWNPNLSEYWNGFPNFRQRRSDQNANSTTKPIAACRRVEKRK